MATMRHLRRHSFNPNIISLPLCVIVPGRRLISLSFIPFCRVILSSPFSGGGRTMPGIIVPFVLRVHNKDPRWCHVLMSWWNDDNNKPAEFFICSRFIVFCCHFVHRGDVVPDWCACAIAQCATISRNSIVIKNDTATVCVCGGAKAMVFHRGRMQWRYGAAEKNARKAIWTRKHIKIAIWLMLLLLWCVNATHFLRLYQLRVPARVDAI